MMPQISTTRKLKKTEWKPFFSPSPPSTGDKYDWAALLKLTSVHGLLKTDHQQDSTRHPEPGKEVHTQTHPRHRRLQYFLAPRSIRTFPRRICSPGLATSDFFLCLKAKLRDRNGFFVPGHLQIWFGKSDEDHQQKWLCHRRSAMATEKKNVCPNQGWIGWKKGLNKFSWIFNRCWGIYTFRIDLDNTSYPPFSNGFWDPFPGPKSHSL
jgi:hypothetical protein